MMRSSGRRLPSFDTSLKIPTVEATLSSEALLSNWDFLCNQVPEQRILPMVKAEAYGHGASWASNLILNRARKVRNGDRLAGFGVATIPEGMALRQSLGSPGSRVPVVVFSGTLPWNSDCGQTCHRFGLTPVISSIEDWKRFCREGWPGRIPFELKFNTGMNRLGIAVADMQVVKRDLVKLARQGISPAGIFSHLACAERPSDPLSRLQRERFAALVCELSPVLGKGVEFHLGNSAAIWHSKAWDLRLLGQRVRPGLSLYGIAPRDSKAPARLRPVMQISAPVVALQSIQKGESVGYGRRFVAKRAMTIAILGMGYADGLDRGLSDPKREAWVLFKRGPARLLGAISMDLCAVEAPLGVQVGDRAQVWGSGIDHWKQAEAAGTIPYELLTSWGARVQRKYV